MNEYLAEAAEWRGHFWPADDRTQAQPGVLSYAPDTGIRLNLIGGFDDSTWVSAPGGVGSVRMTPTREWPVVQGVAAKMPITLLDCIFRRGSSKGFGPGFDEQEIRVERGLIGIHLSGGSSPSFTGIAIELENLTGWAFVNLLYQLEIPKECMLRGLNHLNDTLTEAARLSAKYWP